MKKSEAKQLLVKYLFEGYLAELGYYEKKEASSNFSFRCKTEVGKRYIGGYFNDYNPSQQIEYGIRLRINKVEEILKAFSKTVQLQYKIGADSSTLGFSYGSLLLNFHGERNTGSIQTEKDMIEAVEVIKKFLEETAFPLLDKYENIHEVDKLINGEDAWKTDWHKSISLSNFGLKRLIIAKLCNNPRFKDLIELNYQYIEEESSKSAGKPWVYDRSDLTKPLPAIAKYLESI